MQLFQSWMQSLALLRPEYFKLFVLVTIRSWLLCLKEWVTYWWWLILLLIGFPTVFFTFKLVSLYWIFLWTIFIFTYTPLVYFVTVLCTRPSVPRKTLSYYASYTAGYALVLLAAIVIRSALVFLLTYGVLALGLTLRGTVFIAEIFAGIYIALFMLFALDRRHKLFNMVFSMYNAGVFLLNNLPLFLILFLLFGGVGALVQFIVSKLAVYAFVGGMKNLGIGPIVLRVLNLVRYTIEVCIITNLYVKRVHEQPEAYFKGPIEEK